MLNKHG
jgi:hypothetical protein